MNPANILIAIDLVSELSARIMKYAAAIKQAKAEGRDLTDAELDAMSAEAGLALELAHKRIAALKP